MRTAKTIAVILTVSRQESIIIRQLIFLYTAANSIAPNAPTEADSVGVATPAKIEPSTNIIKIMGGAIASRARFALPFFFSAGTIIAGAVFGKKYDTDKIYKIYEPTNTKPGLRAA